MDQKWLHDGLIVITIFHPELNIERQDLVSAPFAKTEVPFLLQLQTGMRIPSTEVSHYLLVSMETDLCCTPALGTICRKC